MNCFNLYSIKDKLTRNKDACENHDYCYIEMPKEDNKILKYDHGEKYVKVPLIICAALEFLLEKMSTCHNISKNSSTAKINEHTPTGYWLFTHWSIDARKIAQSL